MWRCLVNFNWISLFISTDLWRYHKFNYVKTVLTWQEQSVPLQFKDAYKCRFISVGLGWVQSCISNKHPGAVAIAGSWKTMCCIYWSAAGFSNIACWYLNWKGSPPTYTSVHLCGRDSHSNSKFTLFLPGQTAGHFPASREVSCVWPYPLALPLGLCATWQPSP